jgi:excinuclease ABC subunit A
MSRQSVSEMIDQLLERASGAKVALLAPLVRGRKGEYRKELEQVLKQGYLRARIDGAWVELDDQPKLAKTKRHDIDVVIDRVTVDASARTRLADSLEARAAARQRDGLGRARRGGGSGVQSGGGVPEVRDQCAAGRAAQLLVQLAVRRVPEL